MGDSAISTSTPPNKEIYGIFASMIDQAAVSRVANAVAIASGNAVTHCHLAFQSAGGNVADGIALYNIFKAFPMPLTLYNIGSISSAGVIAYLGAANRAASNLATFMLHKTTSPAMAMTSDRLQATARSVDMDDIRMERILKGIRLTKEHQQSHQTGDLWLSATESKDIGIVTAIAEFAPPKGAQLFYLGPI